MNNWRTTLTGIATAIFAAITALAAVPYSIGPAADVIPPEWKAELFKWCGICAVVSFILKSVFTKDSDIPLPKIDTGKVPLLLVALALLAFGAATLLSGCAIETPKAYMQIPGTPARAYGYIGGGITLDEASAAQ